jgi:hypothetical protein
LAFVDLQLKFKDSSGVVFDLWDQNGDCTTQLTEFWDLGDKDWRVDDPAGPYSNDTYFAGPYPVILVFPNVTTPYMIHNPPQKPWFVKHTEIGNARIKYEISTETWVTCLDTGTCTGPGATRCDQSAKHKQYWFYVEVERGPCISWWTDASSSNPGCYKFAVGLRGFVKWVTTGNWVFSMPASSTWTADNGVSCQDDMIDPRNTPKCADGPEDITADGNSWEMALQFCKGSDDETQIHWDIGADYGTQTVFGTDWDGFCRWSGATSFDEEVCLSYTTSSYPNIMTTNAFYTLWSLSATPTEADCPLEDIDLSLWTSQVSGPVT